MKKKLMVMLLCIVSALTFVYIYAFYGSASILHAQSAPVFELPKGSKVVLGVYNSKEVVWDIGNNNNGGNYVLMSSIPLENNVTLFDASLPVITSPAPISSRETSTLRYINGPFSSMGYCPVTPLKNMINNIVLNGIETSILSQSPFLPTPNDIKSSGTLGLTFNDRAYKTIQLIG